jgi:hypothetical protein
VSEPQGWEARFTWPQLQAGPRHLHLDADAATRARLSAELDLEGLEALHADLTLSPWLDGVEISGQVTAQALRRCGVSLDIFEEVIDEPVRLRVVPRGSPNAPVVVDGDVEIDLEAEDPPDVAEGDTVDVTAAVVEFFALALDPFPRKPGVVFEPPDPGAPISPFAALANLSKLPRSG